MINLDIYNKTHSRIGQKMFDALAIATEKKLIKSGIISKNKNYFIEVTFVGKRAIAKLNKFYRHKACATDVVSLSYYDKNAIDPFVGEIFICVPYAREQAKKLGHSFAEELRFLFMHGLLHIFGFDHKKTAQAAEMHDLTHDILKDALLR